MAKWTFAMSPAGLIDQGPNNSTAEHFKSQDIFSALVRESIQNSLDAAPLHSDKPVIVRYAFGKIEGDLNNSLRSVEKHVRACSEANIDSTQYKRMANFLTEHEGREISYLKVSDYNTTGMVYEKGNNSCGFYSFVESIGKSSKVVEGSGGSYGFGKAAYYEFSNTRSVLVSTKTEDGMCAFRGCSMLCTHVLDGVKYAFSGFFDAGNDEPIQDINQIPEKFRRDKSGSDIFILHVEDDTSKMQDYEDSIVRSVLLNFWMAIYSEKLIVSFDWEDDGQAEVEITKDSLEELMTTYYPCLLDKSEETGEYCNPRPYYEAIKNAVAFNPDSTEEQNCVLFQEDNLNNVGKIKFYLMRNLGTRDRYIRMRKRYMVIDGVKLNGQRGISGVLICEDGVANDNLKNAEPPAHDKWDIKRVEKFKNEVDSPEYKAYKAINALKKYATECIKSFFANASSIETDIEGLDNYLYSTENNDKKSGQNPNFNGEQTGNDTENESGVHNSSPNGPLKIDQKPNQNTGQVTIINTGNGGDKSDDGGNINLPKNKGKRKKKEKNKKREPVSGNDELNSQEIKDVKCKYLFKKTPEGLVYILKVTTAEELKNATLKVLTEGEDGEEEIPLSWSSHGKVRRNHVSGVSLLANETNVIQIRFEDNIKHKISLTAYVNK